MSKFFNDTSDFTSYGSNYSEPRLWTKIKEVALKAGEKLIYSVLVLFYTLKSPDVSVGNKTIILGALGYFILPIDLVPDAIPALGFTDDAAAIALAIKAVQASITPAIEAQARQKMQSIFK